MDSIFPLTESFRNPSALSFTCPGPANAGEILKFHQTLPTYARTPLVHLPDFLAHKLGVGEVFLKNESQRFGLPSFKILGASWAVYRTLCKALQLPHTMPLDEVANAAQDAGLKLVACTDGNWGRAVAFTARRLGVSATVHVPCNIDEATRAKIASEGAKVHIVQGDYDAAIQTAIYASEETGALLVMDTSWPGYEEIPRWVTDGYETLLAEVDEALETRNGAGSLCNKLPDLVVVSVGVGSWAHAVVSHYKSKDAGLRYEPKRTAIVTVEPTTAASLLTSLHKNCITSVSTADTIMCGMNCGTTSTIAWPLLHNGVDVALSISDWDAHEALLELHRYGVDAGPCGAAPLAGLKKLLRTSLLGRGEGGIGKDATVVLFCTEGSRPYNIPKEET